MNLEITTRNYEPTKRVRLHAEERVEKFEKYLRDLTQIKVTLAEEKLQKVCELHLRAYGKDFHARHATEDMLQSVDKACSSMEHQLRQHRDRITDHRKGEKPALSSAAALEQLAQAEVARRDGEEAEEA
jgi:putative sigma-54 modulation protein